MCHWSSSVFIWEEGCTAHADALVCFVFSPTPRARMATGGTSVSRQLQDGDTPEDKLQVTVQLNNRKLSTGKSFASPCFLMSGLQI